MFSRLTKTSNTSSSSNSSSQQAPPTTPKASKTSSAHSKTQSASAGTASPSKIPVASNQSSRSAFNPDSERSNYLSFLFSQSQQGAPTTPVKVNPKVQQSSVPQVYGHHDRYHNPYESTPDVRSQQQPQQPAQQASSDDVHMQTMKNTVNPAMLKQLAALPPAPPARRERERDEVAKPSRLGPVMEDVHMRTVKHEAVAEKPKGLEDWEKRLVEKAENKRKATVAQLYFLEYYFDLLGYIATRKKRLELFKTDTAQRQVTGSAFAEEYKSYSGRERAALRKRRTKLRVDQFAIIAQVGQGGYGSVYLARKIDTREVCALKKMRKATLAKMDEVKHVLVERDILTAVKTPWLVRLLYSFQDRDHVYLAMEYVPGGDFRTLLNNSGVLKEEHARFYAAEMFMGVNELHKLGYIHRDLKPENFLVDGTGHVKLTDFGLATGALNPQRIESMRSKLDQVKDEDLVMRSTLERRTLYRSMRMAEPRYADSVVGSPDYMPPEVLRAKTYTYSADYWSLGCILFEFLCGFPPFSGSSPEETWANLKNWPKVLRRPVYDRPEDLIFNLSDSAWDAVLGLIAHPKDRVSTLSDVQTLPFFQGTKFSSLRETPAPFVPMLDGETDVGYFDSFESAEDMAKYAEVFKKQRDVEAVEERGLGNRNNWVGFTFGKNAVNPGAMPKQQTKRQGDALQTMF